MPAFSSDVYNATKASPADTAYDPFADYLKKRAEAAFKWEGSPTGIKPTTTLQEDIDAEDTFRAGDMARREAAAKQQTNLAGAEDTRQGSIADRVRTALYGRQKAIEDMATKQSQSDRTFAQQDKEQTQSMTQALDKQDFSAFNNATQRYDAIQAAYDTGTAEMQILEANRANALQMADLERYFAILLNDLKNKLKDAEIAGQVERDTILKDMETKASGIGSVITGIINMIDAGINSKTQSKVWG